MSLRFMLFFHYNPVRVKIHHRSNENSGQRRGGWLRNTKAAGLAVPTYYRALLEQGCSLNIARQDLCFGCSGGVEQSGEHSQPYPWR